MNDPKEYIQRQVFTAGSRARISAIQYYEDYEHTYCPFCGSQQEIYSEDGAFRLRCTQNCKGFQEELKLLETQASIKAELDEVQERYESISDKIKEHALDAGTKTAAKHYMKLSDERQAFNSEIEKLTK